MILFFRILLLSSILFVGCNKSPNIIPMPPESPKYRIYYKYDKVKDIAIIYQIGSLKSVKGFTIKQASKSLLFNVVLSTSKALTTVYQNNKSCRQAIYDFNIANKEFYEY